MPMDFIVMGLIGKFKLMTQGDLYAFTVMDMLTKYTWYIALCTKEVDVMVHTYLVNIYSKFCRSHKILP